MNRCIDKGRAVDQKKGCNTRSLREYLAQRSVQVSEQNEPSVEIQVDVGDGRRELICIRSDTDIQAEAESFCRKYELQSYVQNLLAQSMRSQYLRESQEERNQREAELAQQLRQIYSSNNAKEVLIEQSPLKKEYEKEKAQEQTKTYESRKLPSSGLTRRRSSAQLNKENHLSKENRPQINDISQLICSKVGKTNIIQFRKQRSRQRMQAIRREQEQREARDMEQCLFRPKINHISERVDRQLAESSTRQDKKVQRYELLYQNFRQQQTKREQMKENIEAEMSFRPAINLISKKIVEGKRLMGAGRIPVEQEQMKIPGHVQCRQQGCSSQPKTGRKPRSRNTQKLPIGDYLYRLAGKRSSKPHIQQKKQVKALQHSDYLVSVLKQKKLKEIFMELTAPPHNFLSPLDIPPPEVLEVGPYRLLLPLLEEVTKLGVALGEQDFVEAGLIMLRSLTPDQRYEFILKKRDEREGQDKSMQSTMTRTQLRLGDDLYTRGLALNREKAERMEKSREERVREELRGCTFRPVLRR